MIGQNILFFFEKVYGRIAIYAPPFTHFGLLIQMTDNSHNQNLVPCTSEILPLITYEAHTCIILNWRDRHSTPYTGQVSRSTINIIWNWLLRAFCVLPAYSLGSSFVIPAWFLRDSCVIPACWLRADCSVFCLFWSRPPSSLCIISWPNGQPLAGWTAGRRGPPRTKTHLH